MKLAVAILVILGVLAAGSAAILVAGLRPRPARANAPSEMEVVLTTQSLPAASVLTSSYITKGMASTNELPEGYLSSPVQAIGRVLAVPVVEGQVLTGSCFVSDGTGAQLAAALPEGMRAVSVTLSNNYDTGGLLYPGCVVDVLASFKLASSERGQAISTTLLRGIQVLAVEGTSVVSKDATEKAPGENERTRNIRGLTVTLMVDPKQAEALQLARQFGDVSLAMRNPLDKNRVATDTTVLSQGRLATLGSMLDPAALDARNEGERLKGQPSDTNDLTVQAEGQSTQKWVQQAILGGTEYYQDLPKKQSLWLVTVIRGREVKEQELDMPESGAAVAADAKL